MLSFFLKHNVILHRKYSNEMLKQWWVQRVQHLVEQGLGQMLPELRRWRHEVRGRINFLVQKLASSSQDLDLVQTFSQKEIFGFRGVDELAANAAVDEVRLFADEEVLALVHVGLNNFVKHLGKYLVELSIEYFVEHTKKGEVGIPHSLGHFTPKLSRNKKLLIMKSMADSCYIDRFTKFEKMVDQDIFQQVKCEIKSLTYICFHK